MFTLGVDVICANKDGTSRVGAVLEVRRDTVRVLFVPHKLLPPLHWDTKKEPVSEILPVDSEFPYILELFQILLDNDACMTIHEAGSVALVGLFQSERSIDSARFDGRLIVEGNG